MTGRLTFGTAGIRGPYGPGAGHMNTEVVHDTVRGVLDELWAEHRGHGRPLVVVGRDARHGSAELAAEAVDTLVDGGADVAVFSGVVPTPLLARSLVHLSASAGLMVTASHNPATDNGMKVYWSDGAQIVSPRDADIEARIALLDADRPAHPRGHGTIRDLGTVADGSPMVEAYVRDTLDAHPGDLAAARVAYTPLHGVGGELFERVAAAAGIEALPVRSQREPDPDFPGLPSPNPEESGVLDELLATASDGRVDVGVALDPDADRLALVVPSPAGWRQLGGDELGALLAHHLLGTTATRPDRFVASTVVSSRLVPRMCTAAGVRHVETLTGFKWLSRPGLAHPEWSQVLLYEEALGYAVGPHDRDKDGISAALVAVAAVTALARSGRSVDDLLDELAVEHGAVVTRNGSIPTGASSPSAIAAPTTLGGVEVVTDDRPGPDVQRWLLADDTRVIVRPSGTEPKLKYYCEAIVPVVGGDVTGARAEGARRTDVVVEDLRERLGR